MPRLEEVFKMGGVPTFTFVPPVEYPTLLVALRTPGRGIVVEGPSGIGKTTAIAKAIDELDQAKTVLKLSARKPDDVEIIRALPNMAALGTVIIDDFHKLSDDLKAIIADLMKVLADEERADSKLIVIGINKAGDALIRFAHDLNNRLEVITFDANPREKVEQLLSQGEDALKVSLNVRQAIADDATGSFYLAQMLAHECCLESGVLESGAVWMETKVSFEQIRGRVFDRLSRTFMERTQRFARGPRFRPEGRAPYLHLLFWLARSDAWSLSCAKAARENTDMRGSLTQVMEKGYLGELIDGDPDLSLVLHFDETTRYLTVEDPQYLYFIRNIAWSRFASEVGFHATDFPSRYDFALSFAGQDRAVAESLFNALTEHECECFYDKNEQHRMLAQDIEDYLRPIYQSDARFVIVLLGPEYPKRIWTKFESQQFKDRFRLDAIIPVWYATAPTGMFDESARLGGVHFDPHNNVEDQISNMVNLFIRKLAEERTEGRGQSIRIEAGGDGGSRASDGYLS